MDMMRICGSIAVGSVAGAVLFGLAAYIVLMYGPDTSISF